MKLSTIKRICVDAHQFKIYTDENGCQWIGSSNAAYLSGGIHFTAQNIAEIFDLTEKQCEKVSVEEVSMEESDLQPVTFAAGANWAMMRSGLPFLYLDEMLRPLNYRGKLYIVLEEMVRAAASNGGEYTNFYMGENRFGEPLIFLSDGMIVAGVLRPIPEETAKTCRAWLLEYGALELGEWKRTDEMPADDADEPGGQISIDDMRDAEAEDED